MWGIAEGSWEQWEKAWNRQNCSPGVPSQWVRSHHGMCSALDSRAWCSEVNFAKRRVLPLLLKVGEWIPPSAARQGCWYLWAQCWCAHGILLNSWEFPMSPWTPGNFQCPLGHLRTSNVLLNSWEFPKSPNEKATRNGQTRWGEHEEKATWNPSSAGLKARKAFFARFWGFVGPGSCQTRPGWAGKENCIMSLVQERHSI